MATKKRKSYKKSIFSTLLAFNNPPPPPVTGRVVIGVHLGGARSAGSRRISYQGTEGGGGIRQVDRRTGRQDQERLSGYLIDTEQLSTTGNNQAGRLT